jgi:hypothetical protein
VTITELEGEPEETEAEEVKVTKVEAPGVLVGATVTIDEPLPIGVEAGTETESETEGVNEGVAVTTADEDTPVLLGVLEGVEVGGE